MGAPIGATTRLLERDAEERLLEQAVSQAAEGHPRLLVVEGPAGIGKTSLLERLRDLGSAVSLAVRWSRGAVLEQTLAWSVVRQLLTQPVLELTPEERRRMAERAAARALAVLGLSDPAGPPLKLPEALHALYWLAVELSERTPLLLIVDDVQWADRESIAYLSYLANRLEDQAILLALAIRSGEPESQRPELNELRRIPDRLTLTPGPLSRRASNEIVVQLLGERAQPHVPGRFHDLTGGNPFLLRELCRGFELGGTGADPIERAEMTATERVSISVLDRLSRYPIVTAKVAEGVAILGASATLHRLSRLTCASNDEVASAIGQLIDAEILAQPDHTIDFVHPLVRRAAYERLSAARRQVMHAQAAELLREEGAPVGQTASQLLRAMSAGEWWRVAELRQASAEALAVGAPEAATTYLHRALIEPPHHEQMYELLLELGRSELHHDPGCALGHFRHAHGLATS
ncbi:MAG: AAA family ATPase, partial [Solirubrobacterales bacterium]|nr:AAA family ATPase [Solirubrobacterales bacterium]